MSINRYKVWLTYGFLLCSLSSFSLDQTSLNDSTCKGSIKQKIDNFFGQNIAKNLSCYKYYVKGNYQSGGIGFENSATCYSKGKEFYQENATVTVYTNGEEYILLDHTEKSISRIDLARFGQNGVNGNIQMLIRDSILNEAIVKECEIGDSGITHCLLIPNYYWKTKSKAYSVEINVSDEEYEVVYNFIDIHNISSQTVKYIRVDPKITLAETGTIKDYIEKSIRTQYSNYEEVQN